MNSAQIQSYTLDDVFASVVPKLERFARSLSKKMYAPTVEAEDLLQEAYQVLAIISQQIDSKYTFDSACGYVLKSGLGTMRKMVKRLIDQSGKNISLEAWQEYDTGHEIMHRELAARPAMPTGNSQARQRVLTLLQSLSERDRDILLAWFQIDLGGDNPAPDLESVLEKYHVCKRSYYFIRLRVLEKLRSLE